MTILQLEYFQYLSKTLQLTRTAEHFYVSPPAITAGMRRLEEELGAPLFRTEGRNLVLTDAGKIFARRVDEMLTSLALAKEEITSEKQNKIHSLMIGIASPILWSSLFKDFMQKFPDIKINTMLVKTQQLQDPDTYQHFDCIFCPSVDFSDSGFERTALPGDNSPCLVVYKSHPFANRTSIRLDEAKDERFIALSAGYSYRNYFDTLCQLAGFIPNVVLECDFQIRAAMLDAEYGILVTSKNVADLEVFGDVHCIDIIDPIFSRTHYLYTNKRYKSKDVLKIFCNFVRQYYNLSDPPTDEADNRTGDR